MQHSYILRHSLVSLWDELYIEDIIQTNRMKILTVSDIFSGGVLVSGTNYTNCSQIENQYSHKQDLEQNIKVFNVTQLYYPNEF